MGNLIDLKKEVAELEAQAAMAQQPVVEEQAPVETPPTNTAVTGAFDNLLAKHDERAQQDQRERAAHANQVSKTCGECYFVQQMVQNACELCGTVPLTWLPAAEYPENRELDGLRTMAAEYTIEQLTIALRSGWCANRPERQRAAENILAARIRLRDVQEVREKVAAATKAYDHESSRRSELPPKEKVRELATVYERQAAEIRRQLDALKETVGPS